MNNEQTQNVKSPNRLNLEIFFNSKLKNDGNIQIKRKNTLIEAETDIENVNTNKSFQKKIKSKLKRGIFIILQKTLYFPAHFIRKFLTKNLDRKLDKIHVEIQELLNQQRKDFIQFQQQLEQKFLVGQKVEIRAVDNQNLLKESKNNMEKQKEGIIVIGAGGHAKVIIDIFKKMDQKVDYCIGANDSLENCNDVPVIKDDEDFVLPQLYADGYRKIFIAIGLNQLRIKLANKVQEYGFQLINAISPKAIISQSVKLGKGIAIMPGAIINPETIIEDLVIINTGAVIEHDCKIKMAVHVAPQCVVAGNVNIGERTFIGVGSKIIPGINVGMNCTVGAGTVVIRDITNGMKCAGVPAKIIEETFCHEKN